MGALELFLPEATILLGAIVAFLLSVVGVRYRITWMCSMVMAALAGVTTAMHLGAHGQPFFPGIYTVDALSQLLKLGIVGGLFMTLLASGKLGSVRSNVRVDVPIYLMVSALGMMMLVSATELLTLYVSLELSAYGLYILAALHTMRRQGGEAAAKYILFGAASSAVTLYGISLVYGGTGSTYLSAIAATSSPLELVGLVLALAGVLFKLAVFPFHAWAPDTYEGSPHQSATFIGTASKVAAVGVLARLIFLALPNKDELATVLLILCIASMTVGNLAAIVQRDIKRLLAYSTVAHAGYILIGLLCFSKLGVAAALFYVLIYVPIAFGPFLVVCVLGADGSNPTRASLAGLYHRSPLLALTLMVGIFGLAGIPPTAGFAGKWFLFTAAIEGQHFWLVVIAAVNVTISIYYYLSIIKDAYLTPSDDDSAIRLSPASAVAACMSIAMVLVAGFYPRPLWELAEQAAKVLAGG
ncbi:MAG: NADH-quinone oxidoreductase subunit N [Phycisphaerales bacterium]|nr:NADH-quinone oxidoreductase subunit N [Phycisphaerales bacterium]